MFKRILSIIGILLAFTLPAQARDDLLPFHAAGNDALKNRGIRDQVFKLDLPRYQGLEAVSGAVRSRSKLWRGMIDEPGEHDDFALTPRIWDFDESKLFLSQVKPFREVTHTRFIGVHRFWLRPLKRVLRSSLRKSRQAAIDNALHPGRVYVHYDDELVKLAYDRLTRPWWLHTPWNPMPEERRVDYGRSDNIWTSGALILSNDLRVRLDLDEIRGMREHTGWLNGRTRRTPSSAPRSHKNRNPIVRRTPLLRTRFSFRVGLGTDMPVVRTVGFKVRMQIKASPWSHRIVPLTVSAKYDLEDNDMRAKADVVIFRF